MLELTWDLSISQVALLLSWLHTASSSSPAYNSNFTMSLLSYMEGSILRFQLKHKKGLTSSLSSFARWSIGSRRNSSVSLRHSCTFSGDTKSRATLMHDCIIHHTHIMVREGEGHFIVIQMYLPEHFLQFKTIQNGLIQLIIQFKSVQVCSKVNLINFDLLNLV
jgi:hypothetical protein